MLGVLVTSVLTVAGTFTVYTYLAVFIADAGLGPQALSAAAAWRVFARPISAAQAGRQAEAKPGFVRSEAGTDLV